jgi:hypothetical protein
MPYQRSASFSKTPAEIAEEFRSLLSGKTAADLPDLVSATPLFLTMNTKPEDGFRFLSEKKIRACPVFDGESWAALPFRAANLIGMVTPSPSRILMKHIFLYPSYPDGA